MLAHVHTSICLTPICLFQLSTQSAESSPGALTVALFDIILLISWNVWTILHNMEDTAHLNVKSELNLYFCDLVIYYYLTLLICRYRSGFWSICRYVSARLWRWAYVTRRGTNEQFRCQQWAGRTSKGQPFIIQCSYLMYYFQSGVYYILTWIISVMGQTPWNFVSV